MDAIFLNGTVGVGKSTVMSALGAGETRPNATIDLDEIRRFSPAPEGDRFNHELELANLRSLAANYRRVGAERVILAGVIEDADEVSRYRDALQVDAMLLCRLTASAEVVEARLQKRHADDAAGLSWHRARAGELAAILERAGFDELVVDTSDRSADEVAAVIRAAGR